MQDMIWFLLPPVGKALSSVIVEPNRNKEKDKEQSRDVKHAHAPSPLQRLIMWSVNFSSCYLVHFVAVYHCLFFSVPVLPQPRSAPGSLSSSSSSSSSSSGRAVYSSMEFHQVGDFFDDSRSSGSYSSSSGSMPSSPPLDSRIVDIVGSRMMRKIPDRVCFAFETATQSFVHWSHVLSGCVIPFSAN